MTPLESQDLLLLLIVAAGAYVQAVTGFALGLIVVGAATLAGLVPVAVSAAVVNVAALVSVATALRGRMHHVRWRDAGYLLGGMVPAVFAGVFLLDYLSAGLTEALHTVLAASILASGVLLTLKPDPRAIAAGRWSALIMGSVGGLFTGLFSTGGPPIVYHLYRQPFEVVAIRATLLATFGLAGVIRLGWLGARGSLTGGILALSACSIPVVIAATVLARRFPPPLSERNLRRFAFALLIALGAMLLLR